jgi:hypothetical protein
MISLKPLTGKCLASEVIVAVDWARQSLTGSRVKEPASTQLTEERAGSAQHKGDQQMSNTHNYEALEAAYTGDTFRRTQQIGTPKEQRPTHGRRRGKAPQSFNGIHRRRKRKLNW